MSKRKMSLSADDDIVPHHQPDGECVFCCEELTEDNYVEYRAVKGGDWLPSVYCQECIQVHFIDSQWQKYLDSIAKADCAAALRRVITAPPPINVKDAGLPCKDNGCNEEVQQFWFSSDKMTHPAKLKGSLEGAERQQFWQEKREFLKIQEKLEESQASREEGEKSEKNKSPKASS